MIPDVGIFPLRAHRFHQFFIGRNKEVYGIRPIYIYTVLYCFVDSSRVRHRTNQFNLGRSLRILFTMY